MSGLRLLSPKLEDDTLPRLGSVGADTGPNSEIAKEAEAAIHAIERTGWHWLPGTIRSWLGRHASNIS